MNITMEQLRACRTLMREIEAIEDFQRRITGYRRGLTSAAFSEVYYSGGNMRESAEWQALEHVEQLYRERIFEYARMVYQVEQAIAVLQTEQREIVRLRYIAGLRWQDITIRTHYERTRCFEIHGLALDNLGISKERTKTD